jgi:hypothetical protein
MTQIIITTKDTNQTGSGIWTADQPNGKSVEMYTLTDHTEEHLIRYDLERSYNTMDKTCDSHVLDGKMDPIWGWVANANYSQVTISGQVYDSWSLSLGYAELSLVVDASNNNPLWFIRDSPQRTVRVHFRTWVPSVSSQTVFDVPTDCHSRKRRSLPGPLACVARATMIDRAEVWAKAKVPYNQEGHYDGYREDCSGYVSMAWETAKPGYTTFTMPSITKEITKADLLPGDVLLCVTEHVVLFGGWADASHTQYTSYEETRPGEGTVKRTTPYPYWYNTGCFIPHRYHNVC